MTRQVYWVPPDARPLRVTPCWRGRRERIRRCTQGYNSAESFSGRGGGSRPRRDRIDRAAQSLHNRALWRFDPEEPLYLDRGERQPSLGENLLFLGRRTSCSADGPEK